MNPDTNLPGLLRRRQTSSDTTKRRQSQVYSFVYPNRTIHNIETPDCNFRRFSPDGNYLVAFTRNLSGLQVYRVQRASTSSVETGDKSRGFSEFFRLAWARDYVGVGESLHREVCLVTDNGYLILARLRRTGIASTFNNSGQQASRAVYPNTLSCVNAVEDMTLLVVELGTGNIVDTREYPNDIIYLGGHNGLSLYQDRLCVVSLKYQCVRLMKIDTGRLVDIQEIGWYTRQDDSIYEEELRIRELRCQRKRRAETARLAELSPAAKRQRRLEAALMLASTTADAEPGALGSREQTPFIFPFSPSVQTLLGHPPSGTISPSMATAPLQATAVSAETMDAARRISVLHLQTLQRFPPHYRMMVTRTMQQGRGEADGNLASLEPSLAIAPLSGLKQRLLATLFLRARESAAGTQHFYRTYQLYEWLVVWRVQFLTSSTLLMRFVPVQTAISRSHTQHNLSANLANSFSLLAEYDIETTRFGNIWDTSDQALAQEVETRMDMFRAPMVGVSPSLANDVYLREAFMASQAGIRQTRSGGPVQAARKAAALLPVAPQTLQTSPYLDPVVFKCSTRMRQGIERFRVTQSAPIKFYDRATGALRFVLAPGNDGDGLAVGDDAGQQKSGAHYLFHPTLPLVLSTQHELSSIAVPVSNIHYWDPND
ncbi:hypothetical protein EC988_001483 [Linderina pennispora]|nr:hypothetical protein EC988_001483 [Linderina pennispora]